MPDSAAAKACPCRPLMTAAFLSVNISSEKVKPANVNRAMTTNTRISTNPRREEDGILQIAELLARVNDFGVLSSLRATIFGHDRTLMGAMRNMTDRPESKRQNFPIKVADKFRRLICDLQFAIFNLQCPLIARSWMWSGLMTIASRRSLSRSIWPWGV
jgi:hypothetical protein